MKKLKEKFYSDIRPCLKKEMNLSSIEAVPKIEKVVISAGVGQFKEEKEKLAEIKNAMAKICGQNPKVNLSKKAVSAFKLRIGQTVGYSVTLRGEKMYDFISRLINVSIPRMKDFRGLSIKSFDGIGNYSIGVKEQIIMPEIKHEDLSFPFGFQINIRTNAKGDKNAKILLEKIGFPFKKQ